MSDLLTRAMEMRNAIDALESALMGYGDLVDLPRTFIGARDDLKLAPPVTAGQMRRVCDALAECTRIINSEEFTPAALSSQDGTKP